MTARGGEQMPDFARMDVLALVEGDLFSPVYGPKGNEELERILKRPEEYRVVTDREAFVADRLRKFFTILLAAVGTWFLFRVLFRLAQGTQQLVDLDLGIILFLTILTVVWIRATRRGPRRRSEAKAETKATETDV